MRNVGWLAVGLLLAGRTALAVDPPAVEWTKLFEGDWGAIGRCAQQTRDGGFVVAGWTFDTALAANVKSYVVKLDSTGSTQWERRWERAGSKVVWPSYVEQTRDGGYVIAGGEKPRPDPDMGTRDAVYIAKLDTAGAAVWERSISSDTWQLGLSGAQTTDGGFVVCGVDRRGRGDTSLYVVRMDSCGNRLWQGFYPNWDHIPEFLPIIQTSDGGFATTSMDSQGMWLVKLGPTGLIDWRRSFQADRLGAAYGLQEAVDHGFILAGLAAPATGGRRFSDAFLLKTDSLGNRSWVRTFGRSEHDVAYHVCLTSDEGYAAAGLSNNPERGGREGYAIRTDSLGQKQWELLLGTGEQLFDFTWIQQTADGGFIIAGSAHDVSEGRSRMLLMKLHVEPADGRR